MLLKKGYEETVTEYTTEEHTVWRDLSDRVVDLHLLEFVSNEIHFAGYTFPTSVLDGKGFIGGVAVKCFTAEAQLLFHQGYEHSKKDIHDVKLLCKTYGFDMPIEYQVELISDNKKDFLPLLLLGDEEESQIDKYLERGELFVLYDSDLKCVCVVTDEGCGVLEIQNIATDKQYQRQGYATRLIEYVAERFAGRFDKIILGTGDVPSILTFYERSGFTVTHRIADYFTTHYEQPIIEDGILLKDKVYLERGLQRPK
jgi:ribosomal protein S18 acetylase RimI-like enzyme